MRPLAWYGVEHPVKTHANKTRSVIFGDGRLSASKTDAIIGGFSYNNYNDQTVRKFRRRGLKGSGI
jgi:hypothetical protein